MVVALWEAVASRPTQSMSPWSLGSGVAISADFFGKSLFFSGFLRVFLMSTVDFRGFRVSEYFEELSNL